MRACALDSQGATVPLKVSCHRKAALRPPLLSPPAHKQSKDTAPGTIACQYTSTDTAADHCALAQTENDILRLVGVCSLCLV